MSERKTKTVTTPSNIVVQLNEYITAGEFLDLQEQSEKGALSKTQLAKALMEQAVVSMDGSTENIAQKLRDLPLADYTFLSKEVKALVEGNFTEAKNP
jgi:hypothetical protein